MVSDITINLRRHFLSFVSAPPPTYCPARWIKIEESCYRPFGYLGFVDDIINCSRVGGENIEIPENSQMEFFQSELARKVIINSFRSDQQLDSKRLYDDGLPTTNIY